ncbi:unnamed protein product [Merluccius merluccius]
MTRATKTPTWEDAAAPFPRSTWIHPDVPEDDFDRVCQTIWRKARRGQGDGSRETGGDGERSSRETARPADDPEIGRISPEGGLFTLQPSPRFRSPAQRSTLRLGGAGPPSLWPRVATPDRRTGRTYPPVLSMRPLTPVRVKAIETPRGVSCGSAGDTDSPAPCGPRGSATDGSGGDEATPTFGSGQCRCDAYGLPQQTPTTCCSSIWDQDLPCRPLDPEADNLVPPEPSPAAAKTGVCAALLSTPAPATLPNVPVGKASKPFRPFALSFGCRRDSLVLNSDGDFSPLATNATAGFPSVPMAALARGMTPFPLIPPIRFGVPAAFNTALAAPVFSPPVWCLVKAPVQGKAPKPPARPSSSSSAAAASAAAVPPPHQQGAYDLLADFPPLQPQNEKPAPAWSAAGQVSGADGRRRGLAAPPVNAVQQPGGDDGRREKCEGGQEFFRPPPAEPGLSSLPTAHCEGAAVNTAQQITEAPASASARGPAPGASTWAGVARRAAATPEKARGGVPQHMTNANAAGNVKGESPAAKKNPACQAMPSSLVANPHNQSSSFISPPTPTPCTASNLHYVVYTSTPAPVQPPPPRPGNLPLTLITTTTTTTTFSPPLCRCAYLGAGAPFMPVRAARWEARRNSAGKAGRLTAEPSVNSASYSDIP